MQQRNIEMSAFMDPEQTLKGGRYGGPKFGPLMPQEYRTSMKNSKDIDNQQNEICSFNDNLD